MTDNIVSFLRKPYVPRLVNKQPCPVISLPVVRIERGPDSNEPDQTYDEWLATFRRQMSRDICGND